MIWPFRCKPNRVVCRLTKADLESFVWSGMSSIEEWSALPIAMRQELHRQGRRAWAIRAAAFGVAAQGLEASASVLSEADGGRELSRILLRTAVKDMHESVTGGNVKVGGGAA